MCVCSAVSDSSWTVAYQAPLSRGFPRQEYWSRLPCSPPGDLPKPGFETASLTSCALAGKFFTTEPLGKPGEDQGGRQQCSDLMGTWVCPAHSWGWGGTAHFPSPFLSGLFLPNLSSSTLTHLHLLSLRSWFIWLRNLQEWFLLVSHEKMMRSVFLTLLSESNRGFESWKLAFTLDPGKKEQVFQVPQGLRMVGCDHSILRKNRTPLREGLKTIFLVSPRTFQWIEMVKIIFKIIRFYLPFSLSFSHQCTWGCQEATQCVTSQQTGWRSRYENPAVFY